MILGLGATLVCWLSLWAAGELVARLLFGRRRALVAPESRPVLGFAAVTVLLEFVGFFLALRVAAWLLVPAACAGLFWLLGPGGPVRARRTDLLLVSLVGLGIGLVPVLIAGRFTAAALTNNDATYYIAAADRLIELSWATDTRADTSKCLANGVLYAWWWRTGTSNLIGAVSSLSGLAPTAATTVVTAVLVSCVAAPALALAQQFHVLPRSARLVSIGLIASVSAAALFLAYQHLLGQLAAYFLFPLACAATFSALSKGGVRRIAYAAVLLAASLAWLADAAVVLVAAGLVGIAVAHRRLLRALGRGLVLALATLAIAPFTARRAATAALSTVTIRLPSPRPFFSQRGWLDRSVLDDLATVVGVDPWPPWPAPAPPSVQASVMALGALCGLGLIVMGILRFPRRSALRPWLAVIGLAVVASEAIVESRYLMGKILLMAAAFAVPACVVAVLAVRARYSALLAVPYVLAELVATQTLLHPSRWKVIDRPEHDALVPKLAELPPRSLIALDGFGAPSDPVLDAHRAHRAALLARLRPIQTGFDGGFYIPACADDVLLTKPPARAFAVQRTTAERVSVGRKLQAFGDFVLLEIDLQRPDAVLGAWAPTHGWHAAEHEPDGRVFRWAETAAKGTLRAIVSAPCVRLAGELRTAGPLALAELRYEARTLFRGSVGRDWSAFRTRAFDAARPRVIDFEILSSTGHAPDAAHELAVRGLAVEPDTSCLTLVRTAATALALPENLTDEKRWEVLPAVGMSCAKLVISVAGEAGQSLGVRFDEGIVTWHLMASESARVVTEPRPFQEPFALTLSRRAVSAPAWRVLDVVARPAHCKR